MDTVDAILKRDRGVITGALVLIMLLAWGYVLTGAGTGMSAFEMFAMDGPVGLPAGASVSQPMTGAMAAITTPAAWTWRYAVLMFFMWWIMMIAMMLPSASPIILLFARVKRKQRDSGAPFAPTGVFALGYLTIWALFSVFATGAQWALASGGLLSTSMVSTNVAFSGALLIAAGLWQLTPIKSACLAHCRGPMHFLIHGFRPGRWGALRMGLEHGAFCLGCCWFLMALLFAGGVMNVYWIAGLALYVLIEKMAPAGNRLGIAVGVALMAWGVWLLAGLA